MCWCSLRHDQIRNLGSVLSQVLLLCDTECCIYALLIVLIHRYILYFSAVVELILTQPAAISKLDLTQRGTEKIHVWGGRVWAVYRDISRYLT